MLAAQWIKSHGATNNTEKEQNWKLTAINRTGKSAIFFFSSFSSLFWLPTVHSSKLYGGAWHRILHIKNRLVANNWNCEWHYQPNWRIDSACSIVLPIRFFLICCCCILEQTMRLKDRINWREMVNIETQTYEERKKIVIITMDLYLRIFGYAIPMKRT